MRQARPGHGLKYVGGRPQKKKTGRRKVTEKQKKLDFAQKSDQNTTILSVTN